MSVLGCAPASLHPTYDSLLNTRFTGRFHKWMLRYAAPPSGTSGSRAVPAAGARNDDSIFQRAA